MARRGNSSAIIVGRLLGTEGFTEHTASEVKRYWLKRSGLSERQKRHIEKRKKEFSEIMSRLSEAERLVVGKYIGLLEKMQFETGLKIGLTVYAVECDEKREPK